MLATTAEGIVRLTELREEAYTKVLRAFTKQAFDWKREKVLTDLRKELDIGNDVHAEIMAAVLDGKDPPRVAAAAAARVQRGHAAVQLQPAPATSGHYGSRDDTNFAEVPLEPYSARSSRSHVRRPSLEATGPLGMPAIPTSPNGSRHGAGYSLHEQYGGSGIGIGSGTIPSWQTGGARSGPVGASQQAHYHQQQYSGQNGYVQPSLPNPALALQYRSMAAGYGSVHGSYGGGSMPKGWHPSGSSPALPQHLHGGMPRGAAYGSMDSLEYRGSTTGLDGYGRPQTPPVQGGSSYAASPRSQQGAADSGWQPAKQPANRRQAAGGGNSDGSGGSQPKAAKRRKGYASPLIPRAAAAGNGADGGLRLDPLLGHKVQVYWPTAGGWWDGTITDYNFQTGQHCVVYDMNTERESFEWTQIRGASAAEVQVLPEKVNLTQARPAAAGGGVIGQSGQPPVVASPPKAKPKAKGSSRGSSAGGGIGAANSGLSPAVRDPSLPQAKPALPNGVQYSGRGGGSRFANGGYGSDYAGPDASRGQMSPAHYSPPKPQQQQQQQQQQQRYQPAMAAQPYPNQQALPMFRVLSDDSGSNQDAYSEGSYDD